MKDSVITSEVYEPYAQALMSLAKSNNLTDQFGEETKSLLAALEESEELRGFLANPLVKPDQKKAVINQVVGEQVHPFMKNFLLLLVDRRRIVSLEGILKQYLELLRQLNQTVLAEVTSAVELTEEQKQAVRDRVIGMTGARQVDLETRIDRDLIGGVIIRVGSQVVDASLRGQLRRISLRLTAS